MLCIHSRLPTPTQGVVTYQNGMISSDIERDKWMVVKSDAGQWTCVVSDDMTLLNSCISQPDSGYAIVERHEPSGCVNVRRITETTKKIRVSGNINAHIYWEQRGDVQLIVESGANVEFRTYSGNARLLSNIRDRARLTVVGSLTGIAPLVDATSHLDTSRSVCKTDMRLSFRGKISAMFGRPVETSRQRYVRTSISFPHSSSDCRAVDDDTPEEHQCMTCYKYVANAVFSPCKHVYMCLICAERHRRVTETEFCCPLCRVPIMKVEKR